MLVPGIHPIFHASLLSPFRETTTHGPAQSEPPPDIIDNHEEYEVEAIHSHSGKGKRRRYWVKWKGYSTGENTWLTEQDLKNAPDQVFLWPTIIQYIAPLGKVTELSRN